MNGLLKFEVFDILNTSDDILFYFKSKSNLIWRLFSSQNVHAICDLFFVLVPGSLDKNKEGEEDTIFY
jgi:hypothetical protein